MSPLLPALVPLGGAVATLFLWRRRAAQKVIATGAAAAQLLCAVALLRTVMREGIRIVRVGGWPAPYGIVFVADLLGAIMSVVAGLVGVATVVYSLGSIDEDRASLGYYPLVLVLLAAVCGAFLTGDLFNLYVWFELMLIASFVLLVLGEDRRQLAGGLKYVTLNLVGSTLLLAGVGMLYARTGTLNLADMARYLRADPDGAPAGPVLLLLLAFGLKAAVFPLFFWLPASYHTPPPAVSALFAGLLTKVGVYALIRVSTLLFATGAELTRPLLLAIAGATMVSGVLGALAQGELRRLLSFHIISQIGYMVLGLGFLTRAGLAGALFFVVHNILAKTALFLVSGVIARERGTERLDRLGGLDRRDPLLAACFLVPALSLAGIPPLSGFFAKLALVEAGLAIGRYALVAIALGVGLLTLMSMAKIWNEAFWKAAPAGSGHEATMGRMERRLLLAPALGLALATIALGLGAGPAYALALRAADQLLDPEGYITAALGAP